MSGIAGSLMAGTAKIADVTKTANDLSGLVRKKVSQTVDGQRTTEGESSGNTKRKLDEEDNVRNGLQEKRARVDDEV